MRLSRNHWLALLVCSLGKTSLVFAQAAAPSAAPPPSFVQTLVGMAPAFLIAFIIFQLMVIKPQKDKLKAQQSLLQTLKKGDMIVTSGGIIGRVAVIEKDYILIDLGGNARLKVETAHIAKQYTEPGAEKAA